MIINDKVCPSCNYYHKEKNECNISVKLYYKCVLNVTNENIPAEIRLKNAYENRVTKNCLDCKYNKVLSIKNEITNEEEIIKTTNNVNCTLKYSDYHLCPASDVLELKCEECLYNIEGFCNKKPTHENVQKCEMYLDKYNRKITYKFEIKYILKE